MAASDAPLLFLGVAFNFECLLVTLDVDRLLASPRTLEDAQLHLLLLALVLYLDDDVVQNTADDLLLDADDLAECEGRPVLLSAEVGQRSDDFLLDFGPFAGVDRVDASTKLSHAFDLMCFFGDGIS